MSARLTKEFGPEEFANWEAWLEYSWAYEAVDENQAGSSEPSNQKGWPAICAAIAKKPVARKKTPRVRVLTPLFS